ncbi:hypothetical protein BFR06_02640 [Burkholderia pseudomallei]|nr:hypothetical protein BFR05_02635 [Burkholderia pseudomallei]APF96878.1 hypothetical protein BFR06_02640 [Burkholderia pseudomallei]KEO68752.1 hypothetical protein J103_15590 [Burkholderia pseudomallei MSHR5855]
MFACNARPRYETFGLTEKSPGQEVRQGFRFRLARCGPDRRLFEPEKGTPCQRSPLKLVVTLRRLSQVVRRQPEMLSRARQNLELLYSILQIDLVYLIAQMLPLFITIGDVLDQIRKARFQILSSRWNFG